MLLYILYICVWYDVDVVGCVCVPAPVTLLLCVHIFYGIMLMGDLFPTCSHVRDLWVFNVQIWITFGVRSERYRVIEAHTWVNTVPNNVTHLIEPTWYVLGRVTTAFQIRVLQHGV